MTCRPSTAFRKRDGAAACLSVLLAVVPMGCASSASGVSASYSAQRAPLHSAPGHDAVNPPSAELLFAMAKLLAVQGKEEECAYTLHRIISEHPKFLPAYCELAELHLRHGQIAEAEGILRTALEVAPTDPTLENNLALCAVYRKDYTAALEGFTRAAASRPDNAQYRANMAVTLGLMGRYEEALALYKQIVPVKEAYHNLTILCSKDQEPLQRLASEDAPGQTPAALDVAYDDADPLADQTAGEESTRQQLAATQAERP